MLRGLAFLLAAALVLTLALLIGASFFSPDRTDPETVAPPQPTAAPDPGAPPASSDAAPVTVPEPDPGPTVGEMVAPAERNVTPPEILPGPQPEGPMLRAPGYVPPPKPPEPEIRTYPRVVVANAGNLAAGWAVIRLQGIDAPALDATCKDESGAEWPCGRVARTQLARLIRTRTVTCEAAPGAPEKDYAAICRVGPVEINHWLVEQGWATPQDGAPEALAKAADLAKRQHLGLHRRVGLEHLP